MGFTIPTKQSVELSPRAVEHFSETARGQVVKFGVEGGGCAGFQYFWRVYDSLDDVYPDDDIIRYDDFTFVVDGASLMMVLGSIVEYVSDITGNRIEINNPLASAGCGCGVSINFK